MKAFKKTFFFSLSALFVSSVGIGFASEPTKPVDEIKISTENLVSESAEIAEESESKELPESLSCGKCGKKGDHYADCGCGKKKKKKNQLELV